MHLDYIMYKTWFYSTIVLLMMSIRIDSTEKVKIVFTSERSSAERVYQGLVYALDKDFSSYDVEVRYLDTECNPKASLGAIVNLLQEGYDFNLAVGPECLSAVSALGLLTAKLHVTTLAWTISSQAVGDRFTYPTLIGGGASSQSVAENIILLIEKFAWRTLCIYSFPEAASTVNVQYLVNKLVMEGYVIYWLNSLFLQASVEEIRLEMRKAKARCRVIIITYHYIWKGYLSKWTTAVSMEDMHNGDYVFIWSNDHVKAGSVFTSFESWYSNSTHMSRNLAVKVLQSVFMINPPVENDRKNEDFLVSLNENYVTSRWRSQVNFTTKPALLEAVDLYVLMKVYASVSSPDSNPPDGRHVFQNTRNSFLQIEDIGIIAWFDDQAHRSQDFHLYDFVENSVFSVIAALTWYLSEGKLTLKLEFGDEPIWGDGTSGEMNAPRDEPQCGFYGEKCQSSNSSYIVLAVVIVTSSGVFALLAALVAKRVYAEKNWKVDMTDIRIVFKSVQSRITWRSSNSVVTKFDGDSVLSIPKNQKVAMYKGTRVMVKLIRKKDIAMSNKIVNEVIKLSSLSHNNVTKFLGTNVDPPNISVLWEYCAKGSLQDAITRRYFIKLDHVFKFSIAADILTGLQYIHKYIKHHGNLKSSNVVIDSRWTAKLTDFGLKRLKSGEEPDEALTEAKAFQGLLWTAPELLSVTQTSGKLMNYMDWKPEKWPKSKDGDMYSVGIIFKELFCANAPYEEMTESGMTAKEIIETLLKNDEFRPSLLRLNTLKKLNVIREALIQLICNCWEADPEKRPSASLALKALYVINPMRKSNIMDQMVSNMELYTKELERQVKIETAEFLMEKEKCDDLLKTMLPSSVLKSLHAGFQVEAELYESCTLLLSGISGFVEVALEVAAEDVISILNNMYSMFDHIIQCFDVYKVCAIADVYILASGLPQKNGKKHIANIANCALSLLHAVYSAHQKKLISNNFQLRIGIHTGRIVAGVIGVSAPKYDLFGDTINTASRMMTNGKAMRIQMSLSASSALSSFGGYYIADRGYITIKGKGEMHTFWLYGKENFPMPSFEKQFESDVIQPAILPVTTGYGHPDVQQPIFLQDKMLKVLLTRANELAGLSEHLLGIERITDTEI